MPERYRREIEEILRQVGEPRKPPKGGRPKQSIFRLGWAYAKQSLGGRALALTSGRVMVIAVSLLLVALVLRVGLLAWAGLVLFIVGYAMFFVKPPTVEKRWRGQPLDDVGNSWWDRLRRRVK